MLLTLQANAKTITYDQTDMDDFHINFNVFGEDKTSGSWPRAAGLLWLFVWLLRGLGYERRNIIFSKKFAAEIVSIHELSGIVHSAPWTIGK